MDNYSKIIVKAIEENKEFQNALEIVNKNSQGKIWVMGSFVFRNIACALHNLPKPIFDDYDFVVENIKKDVSLDVGQTFKINSFGGLKISAGPINIDIWELRRTYLIEKLNLQPTIENCLKTTSLDIQSIVYDVQNKKVLGDSGINAILNKKISVNNLTNFKYYVAKRNITLEDYAKRKFKKWGLENFYFDWESLK
jgi:hypothetical protein